MSVDLSGGYRAPPTAAQLWRWLIEAIWRVEHAFERSRAKDRPVDDARLRIFLLLALFVLAFSGVALSAGRVALFGRPHAILNAPEASTSRATLEDRNGLLLATDLPRFDLYLDPRDVAPARRGQMRDALLAILPKIPAERVESALAGSRRAFLIGGLTAEEKALVRDLGRGVEFEESTRRVYPLGVNAAHLIGYGDTGGKGLAGAERALDDQLHEAGSSGPPVQLAMDLRVQAALEDELTRAAQRFQAPGAAGIVVDVQTGEILALASYPTFDPANIGASSAEGRKNNVAASVYEAGSVFKVFTLAAGLDAGVVNPTSTFDVSHPLVIGQNHPIHDFDKGDSLLTLPEVFTHSSNIGASKVAMAMGSDRIDRYMRAFGIYAKAPSELAESTRPLTPHRDGAGRLDEGTLAYLSFGQGLSVTPLQIATGMSAVFNGGVYRPLTILKRTEVPEGRRVVSAATSRTMLDFMRLNVTDAKGSGRSAEVPGLSVGGKTGTAQKAANGHYIANARVASFASVFPTTGAATDKRYLVYVLLDEPHPAPGTFGFATAGFTAAPTAGAVINRIAPFLGVKRVATPATSQVVAGQPTSAAMGAD